MPTHAILVTYRDMEPGVLHEFLNKARAKYGADRFKQLYFDDSVWLEDLLRHAVNDTPAEEKLKIFINGHGGTGIQCITADDGRKQTVEDLANLLRHALRSRATSRANSANTEVNMVSCLFGRTPIGGLEQCPAVRLHRELCSWHVYVDLVARTESINSKAEGHTTISGLNQNIRERISGERDARNRIRKVPFTKIRCTYQNGAPVVLIRTYNDPWFGGEPFLNSESLEGRRILWADTVYDEIVKYITPRRPAQPARLPEITDLRHKELETLLSHYDTFRHPRWLKVKLEKLLPEFSKHRGLGPIHFGLPKTAQLITNLLRTYPRSLAPERPLPQGLPP